MKNYYFRFCANVSRSYDETAAAEIATIVNEFNQSLERNKHLICRRLFMSSRKTSQQEMLCLGRAAAAKKSDRKACTRSPGGRVI